MSQGVQDTENVIILLCIGNGLGNGKGTTRGRKMDKKGKNLLYYQLLRKELEEAQIFLKNQLYILLAQI